MKYKDYRTVHIKDADYGSKKVIIHVKKQRYICCNRKERSKLDFIKERCSISKNILADLIRHLKSGYCGYKGEVYKFLEVSSLEE